MKIKMKKLQGCANNSEAYLLVNGLRETQIRLREVALEWGPFFRIEGSNVQALVSKPIQMSVQLRLQGCGGCPIESVYATDP